MSNPVFTSVCITGDTKELKSLYHKMKRLETRRKSLIENGYGHRWLGHLVVRLGGDYQAVYCRGTWNTLQLKDHRLTFLTETAWNAPFELLRLIEDHYASLKVYFSAEGDGWDHYLTNDKEGLFFSARYVVEVTSDVAYFVTIDEACRFLSQRFSREILPDERALYEAIDDWQAHHPDSYASMKKCEVVSVEE